MISDNKIKSEEVSEKVIISRWHNMKNRCYQNAYHKNNPAYIGYDVCEEWLNFDSFKEWHIDNYYKIDGCQMDLDKDILIKGNKLYSPDTCMFVPHEVNTLFEVQRQRKHNEPIGVCICPNYYRASIKGRHLGSYKTMEQAFMAYKEAKENLIKEVAEKYKNQIPDKLYQAMINWKVEITD